MPDTFHEVQFAIITHFFFVFFVEAFARARKIASQRKQAFFVKMVCKI